MFDIAFRRAGLRRGASAFALAAALGAAASAAHAGELSGRVTAAGANVPLEGAIVRIAETGASATTDSDGRYRFPQLPAGAYTVSVSYVGASGQSANVSVPATGGVQQDIALGTETGLIDHVLVVGQRGSLYAALNQQRSADNTISAMSADAIGRLPDQNVAETVRRLPGISIENDQGEGRYVVIRGIDPNLNATSVNGVRLPSPEAGDRKVALDVVDADILDGVTVTKSLTPDLDGDGIGGSIDIETASGFDHDELFIKGQVRGNYTELTEDLSEKLSLAVSDQFAGGKAAFSGSVSWNARKFATDNKEVDGGWSDEDASDGEILFPDEFELREYNVERERLSASLNFDFRPNENTDLYLRGLFNDFRDQEFRQRVEIPFEDGEFIVEAQQDEVEGTGGLSPQAVMVGDGAVSSAANNLALFNGDVAVQRDLKDREETQRIWSVQAGGQTRANLWTFDYFGAYSHAEEDEPGSIDGVTFESDPEDEAPSNYAIGVDVSDPLFPMLAYNPAGAAYFNDPSNYGLKEVEYVDGFTEDNEWSFGADLQREVMFGDNPGYIKFGGKARLREKSYDADVAVYENDDLTLADFAASADYPIDDLGPVVARDFRSFYDANISGFELNAYDTLINGAAEDFVANEDIYALYAMGRVDIGALRLVGGLRWERTEFDSVAGDVREFEGFDIQEYIEDEGENPPTIAESGGLPDGALCYDGDGESVSAPALSDVPEDDLLCIGENAGAKDYDDVLPSMNARWEAGPDVIVRASYYRSVGRPNIDKVVPIFSSEQKDSGKREAFIGNPDLERQVADNFDAGVEWYFAEGGVLSGGVFHKTISDYIATQVFEDVDYKGVEFDEVEMAVNLDDAKITGVEFNYQQALDFLAAPFDGFIIGANYTYVDSEGTLADGRVIPLPKTSEQIFGAQIGYEKYGFDIRVTAQFRDDYLDEINTGGEGVDRYVTDHFQWDARAQYDVTDNFTVFADVTNINDEPFVAYLMDGSRQLLSQYETYSWAASFGVKFQY